MWFLPYAKCSDELLPKLHISTFSSELEVTDKVMQLKSTSNLAIFQPLIFLNSEYSIVTALLESSS